MVTQTTTAMLRFNSRVLGSRATKRLRDHEVKEALRSWNLAEGIVSVRPLHTGEVFELYLDGMLLGKAQLKKVERVYWRYLNLEDARRQGYDDQRSLRDSLRRGGLRRHFNDYALFRIRWEWFNDSNPN